VFLHHYGLKVLAYTVEGMVETTATATSLKLNEGVLLLSLLLYTFIFLFYIEDNV